MYNLMVPATYCRVVFLMGILNRFRCLRYLRFPRFVVGIHISALMTQLRYNPRQYDVRI